MKNLFLLLCLGFLFSSLSAQEKEVVLKTPTGDLYGTLSVPSEASDIPVVLFIAGSGPTNRDGNNPMAKMNAYKMLAEVLSQNGIASLRYDKRGIAQSTAAGTKEADLRFDHYVADAKGWIEYLKKDPRFNQICIIGHSEGSLIGILASQNNPAVNKFISLAGAGEPIAVTLRRQLQKQPQEIRDLTDPILDRLIQGDTVGNIPLILNNLFRPSVQPFLISLFKYDPAKEISKLSQEILLIQGDTDIQVRVEDADLLAKAAPKAQKKIIHHMNHPLKVCDTKDTNTQMPTYLNPDLPLHPELAETVIHFIKEK